MLPILTYSDVGSPTSPGEYGDGEVRVQVRSQHLDVWAAEPDAAFNTMLLARNRDEVPRFALGIRER